MTDGLGACNTFFLLALLIAIAGSALSERGEGADLAAIRDELREVQTSLDPIRIEYVARNPSLTLECVYLRSGRAMRVTKRAPEIGVLSHAFDGEFGYGVMHLPESIDHMESLTKQRGIPEPLIGDVSPLKFCGLPIDPTHKRLYELLDDAVLTGESTYNGMPVINVDLGTHEGRGGVLVAITCKLSREHGFAPVVIARTIRGMAEGVTLPPGVDPPQGQELFEFVVESFRELENPVLGRRIWFPWRLTHGETRIEVTSVSIGSEIARDEFIPQPDSGTRIWDQTAPPGRESSVHDEEAVRRQILAEAPSAIPPLGSGVTAEPEGAVIPSWLWFLLGVIAFSLAAWLWRVRA